MVAQLVKNPPAMQETDSIPGSGRSSGEGIGYPSSILGLPWRRSQLRIRLQRRTPGFDLWIGKIPQRSKWQPTPVLLPGKPHGQRSLVGCSPWGHEESGTTEHLHFHFPLSCIGEGNGNPLQYSCLENPYGQGTWTAGLQSMVSQRAIQD